MTGRVPSARGTLAQARGLCHEFPMVQDGYPSNFTNFLVPAAIYSVTLPKFPTPMTLHTYE